MEEESMAEEETLGLLIQMKENQKLGLSLHSKNLEILAGWLHIRK